MAGMKRSEDSLDVAVVRELELPQAPNSKLTVINRYSAENFKRFNTLFRLTIVDI